MQDDAGIQRRGASCPSFTNMYDVGTHVSHPVSTATRSSPPSPRLFEVQRRHRENEWLSIRAERAVIKASGVLVFYDEKGRAFFFVRDWVLCREVLLRMALPPA